MFAGLVVRKGGSRREANLPIFLDTDNDPATIRSLSRPHILFASI
jgi:hypothetical protein